MSTKTRGLPGPSDPFTQDEIGTSHSPEPWTQEGRYIRDSRGAIVVRGRTPADARRIAAAINATRDIPTEALESWRLQDVSDPVTRPDLEIDLDSTGPERSPYLVTPGDLRKGERRRQDRRSVFPDAAPPTLLFDRRVLERRLSDRRRT
jgi:hypothetical protein